MIKPIVKTPIVGWWLHFRSRIFFGDPFGEIQLELLISLGLMPLPVLLTTGDLMGVITYYNIL